jgi:hypothetical protein
MTTSAASVMENGETGAETGGAHDGEADTGRTQGKRQVSEVGNTS